MIRVGDYVIDADQYGYTVGTSVIKQEKRKDGTVKVERIENARYYNTLQDALQGVREAYRRNLVQSMDKPLNEALTALTEQERAFRELLSSKMDEL